MNSEEESTRHARWHSLIKEQEGSGLSQKAFCKQRSLSERQFSYYRCRLKPGASKQTFQKKGLIPVTIAKKEFNPEEIRLMLPNGFQCIFSNQMEILRIKRLVEVLLAC